jgi:hypothetical protein
MEKRLSQLLDQRLDQPSAAVLLTVVGANRGTSRLKRVTILCGDLLEIPRCLVMPMVVNSTPSISVTTTTSTMASTRIYFTVPVVTQFTFGTSQILKGGVMPGLVLYAWAEYTTTFGNELTLMKQEADSKTPFQMKAVTMKHANLNEMKVRARESTH